MALSSAERSSNVKFEWRPAVDVVNDFLGTVPVDLQTMADALGLQIYYSRKLSPDISGKIERVGKGVYRVTINAKHHENRQRFTLAHEIGHYVLHRDLIGDGIEDDGMYRSRLSNVMETQANRFAASIVMPADKVKEKWAEGVKDAQEMARLFEVSQAAAQIRMDELHLGSALARLNASYKTPS